MSKSMAEMSKSLRDNLKGVENENELDKYLRREECMTGQLGELQRMVRNIIDDNIYLGNQVRTVEDQFSQIFIADEENQRLSLGEKLGKVIENYGRQAIENTDLKNMI